MVNKCTLALEYNYSSTQLSLGTVWLFNGDGRSDLERDEPLEVSKEWVKIAGPIDYELAADIHAKLKGFFKTHGVTVIDEGIAD